MGFGQVPKFLIVVPKRQQSPVGCYQVVGSAPTITTNFRHKKTDCSRVGLDVKRRKA